MERKYKMNSKIIFKKIVEKNLELACKIQNEIFPEEDARQNFIEQINKDPYRKEMDYYMYIMEIFQLVLQVYIHNMNILKQLGRIVWNIRKI